MSGKVVGWAMEQNTGSPITKLVLIKLADNANENGVCWPSIGLMVQHTELAERSVREHLKRLEDQGFVRVERREERGVKLSNIYHLQLCRNAGVVQDAHDHGSKENDHNSDGVMHVAHDGVVNGVHDGGGAAPAVVVRATADVTAPPAVRVVQDMQSHIRKNLQVEPSKEPPSNAGAREVAKDGSKDEVPIPEFLRRYPPAFESFMAAGVWNASTNRADAWAAWAGAGDTLPPADYLIASAGVYFAFVARESAKRRKGDPAPTVTAATFIRKAMWSDHVPPQANSSGSTETKVLWPQFVEAEAKLRARLGSGAFESWLGCCLVTDLGHVVTLTAPRPVVRDYVVKYIDLLEAVFGKPVCIACEERQAAVA